MDGADVGSAVLMHASSGVIETTYSCVAVRAGDGEPLTVVAPVNNTLVAGPEGHEGNDDLLVQTADQWGPFSVTTHLRDAPPPDPGAEWEDVVEVSISSPTPLVVTELVENEPQILLTPEPGEYRLRVCARGRRLPDLDTDDDAASFEENEPPKEWYLLEAWPAPGSDPAIVRLTSPWAAHLLSPPDKLVVPEGEAGLAAAGRVGRDVDGKPGARHLSRATGAARVERTVRGTRRRLFRPCAHLTSWSHAWVDGPSWSWMGGPPYDADEYEPGHPHWAMADDHLDQMSGQRGAIRYYFIKVQKPALAVREWEWVVPPPGGDLVVVNRVPFLPEPTRITVELTQSRDEAGEPWTTISVLHERLPVEWLEDMETY